MGKTPKLKVSTKSAPIRSRAARRATSPSIDTDKSLKNTKLPEAPQPSAPKIPVHHGAGVAKRKTKAKPMSRQKRLRQEKGLQRAEAVMDQMEKKVDQGTKKKKRGRERRGAWDDINGKLQKPATTTKQAEGGQENPMEGLEVDGWEDEGSDKKVADKVTKLHGGTGAGDVTASIAMPVDIRANEQVKEDIIT